MKKIIVLLLMVVAFYSYADDRFENAQPFYGYSYGAPGDGGEGGGRMLVKVNGDDIFDQEGSYPYEVNFFSLIWQAFMTKKIDYCDVKRSPMKYSASRSIYLSDIYLYITLDGAKYRATDIETYFIKEEAVYTYIDMTYVDTTDGLLPFTINDLEGFEAYNEDGELVLVKKDDIKTLRSLH